MMDFLVLVPARDLRHHSQREKSGAEDDGFVPNEVMTTSGPTELPSQLQIEDLSRNPTDESTID
jgi:hypothetical protein